MLVSDDAGLIAHARKLAIQARDPAPHYEHSEMALRAHCVNGCNYRMSNVLAGIGRGQLQVLAERVRSLAGYLGHWPMVDLQRGNRYNKIVRKQRWDCPLKRIAKEARDQ